MLVFAELQSIVVDKFQAKILKFVDIGALQRSLVPNCNFSCHLTLRICTHNCEKNKILKLCKVFDNAVPESFWCHGKLVYSERDKFCSLVPLNKIGLFSCIISTSRQKFDKGAQELS